MSENGFFLMLWAWFKSYKEDRIDFLFQYTEDRKINYNLPSYRSMYFLMGLFFALFWFGGLFFAFIASKQPISGTDIGLSVLFTFLGVFIIEICAVMWPFMQIGTGLGHAIARMSAKNTLTYWIISHLGNLGFWGGISLIVYLSDNKDDNLSAVFFSMLIFQLILTLLWFIFYAWALISKPKPLIIEQKEKKSFDSTLDQHLLDGDEDI